MNKELSNKCVTELRSLINSRKISPNELVSELLSCMDETEDKLDAFLHIERGQPQDSDSVSGESAMYGIPYALKDNICTQDIPTTCASRMLNGYKPPYNATVVERLNRSGALMLGKTNMDEFAMGSSTENSAVKVTKNPWSVNHVPGGSSGGSAAAVAARQVPFALGSDTGGSIRQPASFCGVVGMKPTYGVVSRYGLIAFASSFDQIGPMTRSVKDCAAVMDVLVGYDERESTSVPHPNVGEFESKVDEFDGNLHGWKIGIPDELIAERTHPEIVEAVDRAAEVMQELGAVVEKCSVPHVDDALAAYYLISSSEASSNLGRFDGIRFGMRESGENIEDIYLNTRGNGFGPEVKRRIMLGTLALSSGYYDAYYIKAAKARSLITQKLNEGFEEYDALLSPTTPVPAFEFEERTDDPMLMYLADICTIPANLSGIPAISVPGGFAEGLPVGIQFMGPRFSDASLMRLAASYERATDHNDKTPRLVANTAKEGGFE